MGLLLQQTRGDPQGLQALMSNKRAAPIRQYLRWQNQWLHDQVQRGQKRFNRAVPFLSARPRSKPGRVAEKMLKT